MEGVKILTPSPVQRMPLTLEGEVADDDAAPLAPGSTATQFDAMLHYPWLSHWGARRRNPLGIASQSVLAWTPRLAKAVLSFK